MLLWSSCFYGILMYDDKEVKETVDKSWLHSGDISQVDEDGELSMLPN